MVSVAQTAPNLVVKMITEGGEERTLGFCRSFRVDSQTGQKPIFTVDSTFPAEIAQAAGPQSVSGSMSVYALKGTDPVRLGLIPPAYDPNSPQSFPLNAASRYSHFRVYDRTTQQLCFSIDYAKVSSFSMSVESKGVVQIQLSFTGMFFGYGQS